MEHCHAKKPSTSITRPGTGRTLACSASYAQVLPDGFGKGFYRTYEQDMGVVNLPDSRFDWEVYPFPTN